MNGLEVLRTLRDRGHHHAGPGAHRAGRGGLQGAGAPLRRRRLRHQAVRLRGAAGPGRGAGPPAQGDPRLRCSGWATSSSTRPPGRSGGRGERIELTPKEYTVLEYLMRHAGRVMSRTLITEYAWDYHFDPGTNIVDVVINRLRKKVDSGPRPEAGAHRARRRVRREGLTMTTIRRRLTFWYTVALGGDGAGVRHRCCTSSGGSPACGSWTSASASRRTWPTAGSTESYNVLGRIVTTGGISAPRWTPASAPTSRRSRDYLDRRRHRAASVLALSEVARDAQRRRSGAA